MTPTLAAAALAAALLVVPASAQTVRSQVVRHADLNLSDARDVARLDLRIRRTARDVCGQPSAYDLVGRRKARQCQDAAVDQVAEARDRAIGAGATLLAGR